MKRLLLIDGSYYAYRSFHAIRELSNSRGEPTNAIFGFAKAVRKMLKDLRPDLAACVWDQGLPARRTELQPAYKAHRAEMPDLMRPQLPLIRDLVPKMGIANVSLPNTEADDLMASYTCAAHRHGGIQSILATNDKDLLSLVEDDILVYSNAKADLASPEQTYALLGPAQIREKWGVSEPARILDILALSGDASDGIPGVPGIGPKTATSLVLAGGTLDQLFADLAGLVKNEKTRAKLADARAQVFQNREMVRLDTDLPLPQAVEALTIQPDYPAVIAALENLEFRGLLAEYRAEAKAHEAGQSPSEAQEELFPF
ncbi:MAG: flap endonuclease [Verrucomicrobia bacterium]|nr:flap endonuclease [Verrucomicrobiota bacterium]